MEPHLFFSHICPRFPLHFTLVTSSSYPSLPQLPFPCGKTLSLCYFHFLYHLSLPMVAKKISFLYNPTKKNGDFYFILIDCGVEFAVIHRYLLLLSNNNISWLVLRYILLLPNNNFFKKNWLQLLKCNFINYIAFYNCNKTSSDFIYDFIITIKCPIIS